jgi:hypothetical protein
MDREIQLRIAATAHHEFDISMSSEFFAQFSQRIRCLERKLERILPITLQVADDPSAFIVLILAGSTTRGPPTVKSCRIESPACSKNRAGRDFHPSKVSAICEGIKKLTDKFVSLYRQRPERTAKAPALLDAKDSSRPFPSTRHQRPDPHNLRVYGFRDVRVLTPDRRQASGKCGVL